MDHNTEYTLQEQVKKLNMSLQRPTDMFSCNEDTGVLIWNSGHIILHYDINGYLLVEQTRVPGGAKNISEYLTPYGMNILLSHLIENADHSEITK